MSKRTAESPRKEITQVQKESQPAEAPKVTLVAPKRGQRPAHRPGAKRPGALGATGGGGNSAQQSNDGTSTQTASGAKTSGGGSGSNGANGGVVNLNFRTHSVNNAADGPKEDFTCSSKEWGNEELYIEIAATDVAQQLWPQTGNTGNSGTAAGGVNSLLTASGGGSLPPKGSTMNLAGSSASLPSMSVEDLSGSLGGSSGRRTQSQAAGNNTTLLPPKIDENSSWVVRAMPKAEVPLNSLSIDHDLLQNARRVASLTKPKSAAKQIAYKDAKKVYGLSHVELSFQDAFISRSDMLVVEKYVRRRVLFLGAQMEYEGHSFTVSSMLRSPNQRLHHQQQQQAAAQTSGGDSSPSLQSPQQSSPPTQQHTPLASVVNGMVTEDTVIRFESISFVQTIVVMLTQEMWSSTPDGRIALDWTMDAFLPQFTSQIHKHKTFPIVRVMYVGRLTATGKDFVHSFFLSRRSTNIDELGNEGRSQITMLLRSLGNVVDVSHPAKAFCPAVDSNFLECINLVLERYSNHQVDRRLTLTGQRMTVVTAGKGLFRTSNELSQLTAMRMIDNAVQQCVVVCIGRPPLHKAPLLEYHGSDKGLQMQRSLKLDRNRFYYESPKWAQCLYFCPPTIVTDRMPTFELLTQEQWFHCFARSNQFYGGVALPPADGNVDLVAIAKNRRQRLQQQRDDEAEQRNKKTASRRLGAGGGAVSLGNSPHADLKPEILLGGSNSLGNSPAMGYSASILHDDPHASQYHHQHGGIFSRPAGQIPSSRLSRKSGSGTTAVMSGVSSVNALPTMQYQPPAMISTSHGSRGQSTLGLQHSLGGAMVSRSVTGMARSSGAGGGLGSRSLGGLGSASHSLGAMGGGGALSDNRFLSSTSVSGSVSHPRAGFGLGSHNPMMSGLKHPSNTSDGGGMFGGGFKGFLPPFVEVSWYADIDNKPQQGGGGSQTDLSGRTPSHRAKRLLPLGEYILDLDIRSGSLTMELELVNRSDCDLEMEWRPELATDTQVFKTLQACFVSDGVSGSTNVAHAFAATIEPPSPHDINGKRLVLRQSDACQGIKIMAEESLKLEFNANVVNVRTVKRLGVASPTGGSRMGSPIKPLRENSNDGLHRSHTGEPFDGRPKTPETADALVATLLEDYNLEPVVAAVVPSYNVLFALHPTDPFPRDEAYKQAVGEQYHLKARVYDRTTDGAFSLRWGVGHPKPPTETNWALLCRCPLMPIEVAHQHSLWMGKDAFHDSPHEVIPNSQVSFQELILQRLHQGYQIVSMSENEAVLTLWHQHHRIKKEDNDSISIIRSLHRGVYGVDVAGIEYSFFQWNYLTHSFEYQEALFASQLGPRGAFPWPELDMCLAEGTFCCDREEFKGRQLMYAIIPANKDVPVSHDDFDKFLSSRFSKGLVPKVTSECVWGRSDKDLSYTCDPEHDVPDPLMAVKLEQPPHLALHENDIDPETGKRMEKETPIARAQHVEVSLSKVHHCKCAFSLTLSWLVCGAPLVSDWIKSLQHIAPRYNLRIVGVPCRYDITITNRLKCVYRVREPTKEFRIELMTYCVEVLHYYPDTPTIHAHCRLLHPTGKSYVVSLPDEIHWGENFMVETGSMANVDQHREFMEACETIQAKLKKLNQGAYGSVDGSCLVSDDEREQQGASVPNDNIATSTLLSDDVVHRDGGGGSSWLLHTPAAATGSGQEHHLTSGNNSMHGVGGSRRNSHTQVPPSMEDGLLLHDDDGEGHASDGVVRAGDNAVW